MRARELGKIWEVFLQKVLSEFYDHPLPWPLVTWCRASPVRSDSGQVSVKDLEPLTGEGQSEGSGECGVEWKRSGKARELPVGIQRAVTQRRGLQGSAWPQNQEGGSCGKGKVPKKEKWPGVGKAHLRRVCVYMCICVSVYEYVCLSASVCMCEVCVSMNQ